MKNDELQIYRGKDFVINNNIVIHQPTLDEICDWGEGKYFSFIHTFTATPTDMKYQLHKVGVDWNEISDYDLFLLLYKGFDQSVSGIIFGNLNFADFDVYKDPENEEIFLYNPDTGVRFDRSIYEIATDYIRSSHNLVKNVERAMNETTKLVLLEEAKEQIESNANKKHGSILLPLISTITNMKEFKYGWTDVWNLRINAFMDAVRTVQHIKNVELLLTSGYSGFGVDLKKINKNELNYFFRSNES